METEKTIVKYCLSGREVGRYRGGIQTHTSDGSSTTETIFTRSGKAH